MYYSFCPKFKHAVIAVFTFYSAFLSAQSTTIYINADQGKHVINKNIYGHFAEHLGRCIYDGFYVGEKSTIPNINGIRKDVVDALKDLKIPLLRWPGGCFADTYHWKDGIGPKSERPSIVNQWWGGVTEDNSFGTHDFLNMCELIGAEPYLAGNVGSGEVKEFADWIQYTNHDGKSPMADLRKKNGREKPWKVKYWGVGNEAWGCGGNMTPEYYANIYKQYATFMASWGNSEGIFRIASGANVDDYHWTEVLMRDVPSHLVEGLALHSYSVIDWNKKGDAVNFSEDQYFATMKEALKMERLVTQHSAIMDRYDPAKKIALAVDEWGGWYDVEKGTNPGFLYQQNTMRDAMIASTSLDIFNNHADRVKMANLAQTINVLQAIILTKNDKLILTPTYHVMKMYNVHQNATLIPSDISKGPLYKNGSNSLPALSCSASLSQADKLNITLSNIDAGTNNTVALNIRGYKFSNVNASILKADKVQAHNTFENPNQVQPVNFSDYKISGDVLTLTLPPFAVVALQLIH